MAREFKLDIFDLLKRLNAKDYRIWESLTEEERKAFSALVVERWMSGTSDKRQIVLINELVNQGLFDLSNHPQLHMLLLAIANSGNQNRYQWLGMKAGKKLKRELSIKAVRQSLRCTMREARDYIQLMTLEDIMITAERLGWQKEELNALKLELKHVE